MNLYNSVPLRLNQQTLLPLKKEGLGSPAAELNSWVQWMHTFSKSHKSENALSVKTGEQTYQGYSWMSASFFFLILFADWLLVQPLNQQLM